MWSILSPPGVHFYKFLVTSETSADGLISNALVFSILLVSLSRMVKPLDYSEMWIKYKISYLLFCRIYSLRICCSRFASSFIPAFSIKICLPTD